MILMYKISFRTAILSIITELPEHINERQLWEKKKEIQNSNYLMQLGAVDKVKCLHSTHNNYIDQCASKDKIIYNTTEYPFSSLK